MSTSPPSQIPDDSRLCPICSSTLRVQRSRLPNKDAYECPCPQCGDYQVTGPALACLPGLLQRHYRSSLRLSHAVHWMSREQEPLLLTSDLLERLSQRPLPDLSDQLDLLVRWLGRTAEPGQQVRIEQMAQQAIVGAATVAGFEFVVEHLESTGILSGQIKRTKDGLDGSFKLTVAGWERYREIVRGARTSRRAFMAMQYGDAELDRLVDDVFAPAVKQTGFNLVRLDDNRKAGSIDDKLRVDIRLSRFLIADLTHENRGAYWEAGFAEGLGKPVIYTCEKEKFKTLSTHFDTNHHLTAQWDRANLNQAAAELKATIRATLPGEALLEDPGG